MKETYKKPVLDVKDFKTQDVVTTSTGNKDPEINDGDLD